MFVDPSEVEGRTTVQADVCVVGAGAAGITVARECAAAGRSVAVVESGGLGIDAAAQTLNEGEISGLPYPLTGARLRGYGGTTNHWGGWCRPLEPLDYEARPGLRDAHWPLAPRELEPYYARAHEILEIGPPTFDAETWRARTPGAAGRRWMFNSSRVLEPRVWQVSHPGVFNRFRDDIKGSSAIRCFLGQTALRLRCNPEWSRVERVDCASQEGKRLAVQARHVVLANGALEVPRLLLLSARQAPRALGNLGDAVGRYFMEHPAAWNGIEILMPSRAVDRDVESLGVVGVSGTRIAFGTGLSVEAQRRHRAGHGYFLISATRPFDRTASAVHGYLADGLARARRVSPDQLVLARFNWAIEQMPNANSRVRLGHAHDRFGQPQIQLEWRITQHDREHARTLLRLVTAEVARLEIGRTRLVFDPMTPEWTVAFGNHQMGTARMHRDPQQGVVDLDCRVHGTANLFVASSAVFPTSGVTNPTLTIVALAVRMAARLCTDA